jgi:N-acetylglutamate synthase-like GNAT family acetyltransferase
LLRAATADDSRAIHRLVISGGINPTGLDWRRFVVAISAQGEVIGCGQVKPHRDGSLELASIAVTPEWRGQGVARAIIERLLAENPGALYLMCRSGLGGLYEKFGFRVIQEDEMPRYFHKISRLAGLVEMLRRDGESLLVMKREAGSVMRET